ncbi:matrixin family metalloprotease [Pseudarthrobacter sp. NPDC092424]|uniref:matrixin family metalloprotease n=1 Tax=Pseudarthrobacter sp. NPDC092424 TaxID=3364415 RepID=UPI00380F22F7
MELNETRTPRHVDANARKRSSATAVRILLAGLLCAAAAFGGAAALDDPRIHELLDIRIGTAPRAVGVAGNDGAQPASVAPETPPPGFEEADEPLSTPARPAVASDSYRFLAVNGDGSPVGYSPCRPLHYVVNAALAPAGAEHLVPDAISAISAATGITFVYDGTTAEQPSAQRPPYQPEAYGERWAPLLISWTTPEAAPQLKGKVIGTGGSTHFGYDGGPKTFVTGGLDLDAPQIANELQHPDGPMYATAVILHELSHVMGLDHVEDHTQLMYPEIGLPEGLSDGDLNGLFQLSKVPCRKDL